MILESLAGSFTDKYNKIEAYANELRLSNPGSDVIVTLSKDALAEGKRRFSRMYSYFHALKMGFKRKAKGQVLVVVALDSMNHFYPIAWAVVDKETKVTWTWFLTLLNNSLDLKLGEGYTFMSDMQKGLIEAVQAVVPDAHHRYCVRHIEANWCRRWGAGDLKKKYLWWCAWSSYEADFKDQLKNLGEIDEKAVEDLLRYPPQSWCRAYFDTVCKNQQVDNNLTESFNSWILDARHKPIIRMLEDIRVKLMNMLREHESEVLTWTENVSPHTMQLYYQFLNSAQKCTVDSNGKDGYEVNEGTTEKHRVNINLKKYTCRTWDLTGIPCPHAIRALLYKKVNPVSEIHWWFTKEAYLSTYAHKLEPIRGEKFWNIEPTHAMDPPLLVNMAGRPKVKRTREKNETINRQGEWSQSRKGRVMTCSTCGKPGHNARGCQKQSKGKQPQVGKKTKKRSRTTVDEDHEDNMARSPAAARLPLEEELQLNSTTSQSGQSSKQQFWTSIHVYANTIPV
ncbi:PREDICTED: uncharacterized protein LOC109231615 [Nicotiana attenuata]|uniref:uncharacterized protein LOC109231615 n=1 Tax=Nicotiana attenuata TaxID=49451 RepID=UPI000905746F|nr:PREDICTED: uncharacterized protein LOC109231615 [Nicotiana attenuata]